MKTLKYLWATISLLAITSPASAIVVQRESDLYDYRSLVDPTFSGTTLFSGVGHISFSGSPALEGQIGYSSSCTGSLVSASVVLTAAHCLGSDQIRFATLMLPDAVGAFAAGLDPVGFAVTGYLLDPEGGDIALLKLGQPVENAEIYGLYEGDPLGKIITRVGTGSTGTGETGAGGSPGIKRYGYNTYDGYLSDIAGPDFGDRVRPAGSVLIYDFDDGTAAHDALGRLGVRQDADGVVIDGELRDAMAAPGDSGGAVFIDGRIAAISGFGVSACDLPVVLRYTGTCGMPGSIDNSYDSGNNRWTNFSFGEIGGDVSTNYYKDFITGGLNGRYAFSALGAVPEPSTWLTMILGFAMIGAASRRRRTSTSRALACRIRAGG